MTRKRDIALCDEIYALQVALSQAYIDTHARLADLETHTAELLLDGTQTEELHAERLQDIRQATFGYVRVACRNCDGEYYTHHSDPAPHFCTPCEAGGYRSAYPDTSPVVCPTCETHRRPGEGACSTCRYWIATLADPGALIIDGHLYFIGDEPEPADLAANPKLYGCYGTGFLIGRDDGTQTVTHNLGQCGEIPAALRPADNAAFIGEPEPTPTPAPPAHQHFEHLDYIGGTYPYECGVCYRRFSADEVPVEVADAVTDSLYGGTR